MSDADKNTRRVILHVDMDAFYASIEQRDDKALRGKPVIVGGSGGRGVVAAASYEVRRFGVRSAMPVREALRRCPDAICVRPRIAHYREVSKEVFAVFREFTPIVEGLSLDEAFLDVSGSGKLFGSAREVARQIKARISERTGLTASVGGAHNKLVAKIASDLDKPDGLCIVPADKLSATLDPLPVGRIPGIGPKSVQSLKRLGVTTIGALRQTDTSKLRPVFGRYAERMRERAAGIDSRPVKPHSVDKSISAEETFDIDQGDREALIGVLRRQAEKVAGRVRHRKLAAGVVRVKIRTADFRTRTRQKAVQPPTSETRAFGDVAQQLLETWLDAHPAARLRLLGVGAAQLVEATQIDLFGPARGASGPERGPGRDVDAAVDEVRERFGVDSLQRGSRMR